MQPGAPVIMMTAYASVDLAVEAMKLGATDFVRKPMTPEILRNALKAGLAKVPERHQSKDSHRQQSTQITMNGFSILPATDIAGVAPQRPNERWFIVRGPGGQEQQVVVEIHPDAVSAVEKVTNDLPLGEAFWTEQAEQFLRDFLWNDGNAPATGRLTLKGVEHEALAKAARKEAGK
jgi:YesN/AraC family two-component response regulator